MSPGNKTRRLSASMPGDTDLAQFAQSKKAA
jgi:hypothetical protein